MHYLKSKTAVLAELAKNRQLPPYIESSVCYFAKILAVEFPLNLYLHRISLKNGSCMSSSSFSLEVLLLLLQICSFITGSYDRTCKVWDTASGEELHTLEGHKNVVYAVAFNNPYG